MAAKNKNISPMDGLRIRFIEVLDAIMRDNPKVRSVKHIARLIDTPYLGLHKVYNFHRHKTAYPSSWHLISICAVFKNVDPEFLITGKGKIYRDMNTESKLTELEKEVALIKKILNMKPGLKRVG